MFQRTVHAPDPVPWPARRSRVVIEDAALATAALQVPSSLGLDVTICSGPSSEREPCPLVLEGRCPLGPCDVVVCGLDGPWATSVHAAWREAGAVVLDGSDGLPESAEDRLRHHLGAAVTALFS
jgi:hypothetical protein